MKKIFKHLVVILVLLFSINSNSQNITYYVSNNGNDSNNGLSTTTPFKTLAKLKDKLHNGGDKGYIMSGIYYEYTTFNQDYGTATASNPIIVEAYGDDEVIIDGILMPHSTTGQDLPHLVNIQTKYFILRGIELRNSGNASVAINANYVTIDNLYIHNGYSIGIGGYGLNATVSNCQLHDFYDSYFNGENADGISFATITTGTGGHHIFNNIVYNCSDDGIDTWNTTGNIIEGNTVFHTGYALNPSTNLYEAAGEGNGIKAGGGSQSGSNIVRKNVSYSNRNSGFDGNSAVNNQFYNNTSYNNPYGFFILSSTDKVKNNLAINNGISSYTGTLSTNIGDVAKNSWNLGIINPNFVDPNATYPDLQLSGNSHAINVGVVISGITYYGSKPDLGAYEYGLGPEGLFSKNKNIISKNNELSQMINIFPNPVIGNSIIKISTEININNAFIDIYDSLGNKMKTIEIFDNESTISNEGLKKGICFYIVFNNGKKIAEGKLVVE